MLMWTGGSLHSSLESIRVLNPGVKQVRIHEEKKEVDILGRVCKI